MRIPPHILNLTLSADKFFVFIIATCLLGSTAVSVRAERGWEDGVEERLQKLERIIKDQSLSDIVLQIQRLRDELKDVRGKLELQQRSISKLERQKLGGVGVSSPTSSPGSVGVSHTSPLSNSADTARTTAHPKVIGTAIEPLLPAPVTDRNIPPTSDKVADEVVEEAYDSGDETTETGASQAAVIAGDTVAELEAYQQAFDMLKSGRYESATQGFIVLLQKYPRGQYASNAQYWLGETYYVNRDFEAAAAAFNQLLDKYPNSNKVAGAMLKLGFISHEHGNLTAAKGMLAQVVQRYPTSTEAKLAQQRLDLLQRNSKP